MGKFKGIFRKLRDPRAANASYELLSLLSIALVTVLCGGKSATDMADFAARKQDLLRRFLPLPRSTPSHDTFSDLFRALDPQGFERVFRRFVAAFARFHRLDLDDVIAVDGKSLRGAYERGKSATPMHLVNAFAVKARLALAARKAPRRKELDAALEILQMLRLKRKTVTADALFCSRAFARCVLDRGGHYVLALKANQGKLLASVVSRFAHKGTRETAREAPAVSHDRREQRRAAVMRDSTLAAQHNFPGIAAIGRITCWRKCQGAAADKPFIRYFLLSKYLAARRLLAVVRSHWAIENTLHWVLDVDLAEDANRARKDAAPENLGVLRRLALNLLHAHPAKMSIRRKINAAAWDDNFLLSLFA
jgi:predicted transposase YbfD/YdcC